MLELTILDDVEREFNNALKLAEEGREKEAIVIMSRCMRRLERYISEAGGRERIRAIILLRQIGRKHTELSERQFQITEEDKG